MKTDPQTRKAVVEQIEKKRDEIIEFLRILVSFPSVTGNECEIQQFIAQRLKEMELEVTAWEPDLEELRKHPAYVPVDQGYSNRPNVVGLYKGSGKGRSLLLNGHVDVIPPGPLEAWKHSPWGGEIEGTHLYGRGTSDMKSGLAAMTMAVYSLQCLGIQLNGDVILEYTVDEERSGNGTLACVMKGYRADVGICCETSSLHVQPACIGRIWFEIHVQGKPAGIQRSWEGINAIEKGYAMVQVVAAFGQKRVENLSHPLYPNTREALPCMVGVFESGSFHSAFPDTCLLKGSLATLPGESTVEVKQAFTEYLGKFSKKDPWLKDHPPKVQFKGYCGDPAEISPDHPIVESISRQFVWITGKDPQISGREGAADIRYLIRYGETPTVIFGPGSTEQMHANDEWVDINDLITATKVLALTLVDWCGCD